MDIQKWKYYHKLESKCIDDKFYLNRIVTLLEPLISSAKLHNYSNEFLKKGAFLQILADINSMLEYSHSLLKEVMENVDKEDLDYYWAPNNPKLNQFKRYDRLNSLENEYQKLFKEIMKRKEYAESDSLD